MAHLSIVSGRIETDAEDKNGHAKKLPIFCKLIVRKINEAANYAG